MKTKTLRLWLLGVQPPYEPVHNFELQKPSHDFTELYKIRQSLEPQKLWK